MKSIKEMTDALVKDAVHSCSAKNKTYLRNLVWDYFNSKTPEEIRIIYQDISVDIPGK